MRPTKLNNDTDTINSIIGKSLSIFSNIETVDPAMRPCLELAREASHSNVPVLVIGEPGAGKSLLAQVVHYASPRNSQPCVILNCASIQENFFEVELFGIAYDEREVNFQDGCFAKASQGTLIIEEVDRLPLATQREILKTLADRDFLRVGGRMRQISNARIVATSSRDLAERAADGVFLDELLYRLNEITLRVPPLRLRKGDLPWLVKSGLKAAAADLGKPEKKLSRAAFDFLDSYDFPGNVRELMSLLHRAMAHSTREQIYIEDFGVIVDADGDEGDAGPSGALFPLAEMEKRHIQKVLRRTNGDRVIAARILQIPRTSLERKILLYRLM